jgi:alpha-glucosidase
MFDFGLFGIPMVGSDICGFEFNTDEELCTRWIQVGAFYPFSRSHNALGFEPHELYRWESVTTAAIDVLHTRYRLLPFLYTLFYSAHTEGATVVNPFWYNFPNDRDAYELTTYQYMWGSAILFTPVVEKGETIVAGYFPSGLWYNLATMELQFDTLASFSSSERTFTLDTPLLSTNIHLMGGHIVPTQDWGMTTTASRATNFTLLAALDEKHMASGDLYWDNGDQLELTNYIRSSFNCAVTSADSAAGQCTVTVEHDSYSAAELDAAPLFIKEIVLVGRDIVPATATINTVSLNGVTVATGEDVAGLISIDSTRGRITLSLVDVLLAPLGSSFKVSWA